MKKSVTTIQFYAEDKKRIDELSEILSDKFGSKISKRTVVMMAISKMLEEINGED